MNKENDLDHVTEASMVEGPIKKCYLRRNGDSNKSDENKKGSWTL